VVAGELRALGIKGVREGKSGVNFEGDSLAPGYRANLWLRSAIRVLVALAGGPLGTEPGDRRRGAEVLYDLVRDCGVPWHEVIPPGCTFSIEPRLWSCTDILSTQLLWARVKDAVCDAIKDARSEKPNPPAPGEVADVPLYVAAYQDTLTIYRDLSGNSLHRRGYRDAMHKSPLNEAAAAGVLLLAGWGERTKDGAEAVLADPMCGSGTLLLEALLIARNQAPGLSRQEGDWPCTRWPDFDKQAWAAAVQEARDLARPQWNGLLMGNDVHEGAFSLALRDTRRMGALDCVSLHNGDAAEWVPHQVPDLVVTNPPWGLRLTGGFGSNDSRGGAVSPIGLEPKSEGELETAWRALSTFLRAQCPDRDAYVLSGNRDAFNPLRMKPSAKWALGFGGVDVRLHKYHVLPPKPPAPAGPPGEEAPAGSAAPAAGWAARSTRR